MHYQGSRPNVLWITFEDTSPRFGCYGDPVARTPNIDRVASDGVIYQNAFSTAGVCSPSRCSVITGMYAPSIGAHHHRTSSAHDYTRGVPTPYETVPPPYVKLLPEYLRAHGYYCTNNSKTDYQFAAPCSAWHDSSTSAHWRNRDGNEPFFSVFNIDITHESGMWREYDQLITDPQSVSLPPYLPDTEISRQTLALHYDNLAKADGIAGKLLLQLEEDGLFENTIVFIWSDHGEGIPRSKRWLYDTGIRVPLIIRWPGKIVPATVSEDLISTVDLGPTVLSLLDLPIPVHMQGYPAMGPSNRPREYIYAARDRHDEGYDMVRAIRDRRYKYIRNYYSDKPYFDWVSYGHQHPMLQELWKSKLTGKLNVMQQSLMADSRPPEEMYDVVNDPYEVNNIAQDPRFGEILNRLRNDLDRWRDCIGDMGDVPESQMANDMWPDGKQPQTANVLFVPINEDCPGLKSSNRGEYDFPMLMMLFCGTQGSSIVYRVNSQDEGRWHLYTGPFPLKEGVQRIEAKAIRIGYKVSDITTGIFRINSSL